MHQLYSAIRDFLATHSKRHTLCVKVYKELQGLMSNFAQLTDNSSVEAPCPYLVRATAMLSVSSRLRCHVLITIFSMGIINTYEQPNCITFLRC